MAVRDKIRHCNAADKSAAPALSKRALVLTDGWVLKSWKAFLVDGTFGVGEGHMIRRNALLLPGIGHRGLYPAIDWARHLARTLVDQKSPGPVFFHQLFFQPVLTGYQAVFGIGSAQQTATAVGLYASLITSIVISCRHVLRGRTRHAGRLRDLALSFPGRQRLLFFVLSTRMISPVAVLVFYHVIYSQLGLTDTKLGLVLVTTFINLGLATWIMKGFFDAVPAEVENIALVNGYSRLYAFRRLVLPMVRGGVAATAGFCFIFASERIRVLLHLATTRPNTSGQDLFGDGRNRHGMDTSSRPESSSSSPS